VFSHKKTGKLFWTDHQKKKLNQTKYKPEKEGRQREMGNKILLILR
jgi:hypothetical protein